MHQQVNLYQPVIVKGSGLLASSTVAGAFGIVILLLLSLYVYGVYAVTKLSAHVEQARSQQQNQAALLALNAANTKTSNLADLQAEVRTLNVTLADHRRALQLLRIGVAGGDSGFSDRLIALANRHIDGLWLDHIVLGNNNGVESLSGGTTDADLIPQYIASLSAEPALKGTHINQFQIVGKNVPVDMGKTTDNIEFTATSLNAAPKKPDDTVTASPVAAKQSRPRDGQS